MFRRRSSTAALAVRIALCGLALAFAGLPAQNLPAGFVDELVVSGLSNPVGMSFLPDGRILVLEQQTGRVLVVAAGNTGVVGQIPSVLALMTEQGALGIAVDPDWPQWPYIYVTYTHQAPSSLRLLRYTVVGDLTNPTSTALTLTDPFFILDDLPDTSAFHQAGTIRFGVDGMLYMAVGDDLTACDAQDVSVLSGAILRLDVAALHGLLGGGPPSKASIAPLGNPYVGTNAQLVWASGLRNPFRFNIDPLDGSLYVGDVGQSGHEELNVVAGPGQNFGWPLFEGPAPLMACAGATGPYEAPAISYAHPSGGGINQASIIPFGGRYRNILGAPYNFGPSYEGTVFYLDFWQGFLRNAEFNGSTWQPVTPVAGQPNPTDWATGMNFIPEAIPGPDGAIYYVKWVPGSIRRLRPDVGGRQLTITSGNHQIGNAGWVLPYSFRVRLTDTSGAPVIGVPVTYQVTAGGGTVGSQPVVTDANGNASTSFQLPHATAVNPIEVTASAPGAMPVTFDVTWRGLSVDYSTSSNALLVRIRHSQTNSPFFLGWQFPPAASILSAYGDVALSLNAPNNILGYLDGLGIFGAPNPAFVTNATFPEWTATFTPVPITGGVTLIAQAFAVDTSVGAAPSAFMISNAVMFTLP